MTEPGRPTINTRMPKGAKRPKTSRACLACRKLKARCEPSGGKPSSLTEDPLSVPSTFVICHRCKTLCIDCFYESSNGQVVKGEEPPSSTAPDEQNYPSRSSKRSRPEHTEQPSHQDRFSNDRAVFLSSAIMPSPLSVAIYRDVEISSQQTASPNCLERPTLVSSTLSRLMGTNPTLKPEARDYLLRRSGAYAGASDGSWKHAAPNLCAGKAAASLMAGQTSLVPVPQDDVDFLVGNLAAYEAQLITIFQGLYQPFSPFLSLPIPTSLTLSDCRSDSQRFVLFAIYLASLSHLDPAQSIASCRTPLRRSVDAFLRRAIHSPVNDHLNILALHTCATLILFPVDGFVLDNRPLPTPYQENDGLLEFATDLNPRATIITAINIAQKLGYASIAARLPQLRQASGTESPQTAQIDAAMGDEYAHAVFSTFTWITLLHFRAAIDVAEERTEWDSLSQFEQHMPDVRIDTITSAMLPPPAFLSIREQSRVCWMTQRAELYAIARNHRHMKRSAAAFTKKEAEEQAAGYKRAFDEWRFKFGEQMRSLSTEFRHDPRGLGLHRFYSLFSHAEAASLHVSIGTIYHNEIVADMRQRLSEPFFREDVPWKTSAAVMLGHEEDHLTKALLISLSHVDAMLKAMSLVSTLSPVMPQLYDYVSWEESLGSEIPSLCIVASPILQAGLFAVPILAATELRISVIEVWGASAAHFNPYLLSMLTNCVKSLRASHVLVQSPGLLKLRFQTANAVAQYLQGPCEILMRKVAAAEERLQISHVESILSSSFLLSSKKKQVSKHAEALAPDVPEFVQNIADSQAVEDQISASMQGSLHVQVIQEIEDIDLAVKTFGSDLRQGDVKPIRKGVYGQDSPSVASDADADGQRSLLGRSSSRSMSTDLDQKTSSPAIPKLPHPTIHRSVQSTASASQVSSPASSVRSISFQQQQQQQHQQQQHQHQQHQQQQHQQQQQLQDRGMQSSEFDGDMRTALGTSQIKHDSPAHQQYYRQAESIPPGQYQQHQPVPQQQPDFDRPQSSSDHPSSSFGTLSPQQQVHPTQVAHPTFIPQQDYDQRRSAVRQQEQQQDPAPFQDAFESEPQSISYFGHSSTDRPGVTASHNAYQYSQHSAHPPHVHDQYPQHGIPAGPSTTQTFTGRDSHDPSHGGSTDLSHARTQPGWQELNASRFPPQSATEPFYARSAHGEIHSQPSAHPNDFAESASSYYPGPHSSFVGYAEHQQQQQQQNPQQHPQHPQHDHQQQGYGASAQMSQNASHLPTEHPEQAGSAAPHQSSTIWKAWDWNPSQ